MYTMNRWIYVAEASADAGTVTTLVELQELLPWMIDNLLWLGEFVHDNFDISQKISLIVKELKVIYNASCKMKEKVSCITKVQEKSHMSACMKSAKVAADNGAKNEKINHV